MRPAHTALGRIRFENAGLKSARTVMTSPLTESPNRVPAASVPMIEALGVHLTLASSAGPVNILKGVDLTIARGEAVALVGPSGSGKTSLLMTIAGLERPTSGRVRIAGADLSDLDEDRLALLRRESIGIVFQDFHLIPTMTALENVAVPLELARHGDAFARARAALERVGLGPRLSHYPGQLSGGEEQRVALARAFVIEPKLLLADEPTGNLDRATGQAVVDLLFALHDAAATTLLLVTHEEPLAARCDRVVHLEDGRIAQPGVSGARAARA
jgi:putative ABC transport system ATP-binding protein